VPETAKMKRAGEADLVTALKQGLEAVGAEIASTERQLAELNERQRRIQQAFDLLANGATAAGSSSTTSQRSRRATTSAATRRASVRRGRRSRNPGHEALLSFVREKGSARVADVAKRYGVTPLTARTWLTALGQEGKLRQSTQGRAAVWEPAEGDNQAKTETAARPVRQRKTPSSGRR
jgi:hypothetical protein